MKKKPSQSLYAKAILLALTLFVAQTAHPQAIDSKPDSAISHDAIHFQLIGGLGVYYIGDWSPVGHIRIGADFSANHSDHNGDGVQYAIYSSGNSSPSTRHPDQTSNSYKISLSGLYLQNLIEYRHTGLYCGVGPTVSYSWSRWTSTDKYIYSGSNQITNTYDNENTQKTVGVGPLAIFGLRSGLSEHVSLTAEITFSGVYEWNTQTSSEISTTSTSSIYYTPTVDKSGDVLHQKGLNFSISAIRIGLIIEL